MRAVAAPIPRAPPVMMATLSCIRPISFFPLFFFVLSPSLPRRTLRQALLTSCLYQGGEHATSGCRPDRDRAPLVVAAGRFGDKPGLAESCHYWSFFDIFAIYGTLSMLDADDQNPDDC
ncbi:hypothetical protein WBP06_19335 [Novosphingobium sp. BL-8H]|uniref:hypothetical protein n=1 Tax=Novosphingobium sp. BL-8H TaxID=3127640 RepID=UPI003756CFF6